jgi:hypothetical protein
VSDLDDSKCSISGQRDRVAGTPVRDGTADLQGLGRRAVRPFERERESHPVSLPEAGRLGEDISRELQLRAALNVVGSIRDSGSVKASDWLLLAQTVVLAGTVIPALVALKASASATRREGLASRVRADEARLDRVAEQIVRLSDSADSVVLFFDPGRDR